MTLLAGQNAPTNGGTGLGSGGSGSMAWYASFTVVATGTVTSFNIAMNNTPPTTCNLGAYDGSGNLLGSVNGITGMVTGVNSIACTPFNLATLGATIQLAWQFNTSLGVADDGTTFKCHKGTNTLASGMPGALPSPSSQASGVPTIWLDGTTGGGGGGGGGGTNQGMAMVQVSPGGTPTIDKFIPLRRRWRRRVFSGLGQRAA